MRLYISDSCVVIRNPFEDKCFIYDRILKIRYDINDDAFDILKFIFVNHKIEEDFYEENKDFIVQLLDYGVLKQKKQQNRYNLKELKEYNNVRIFAELTNKCNLKCKHCYGSFEQKNSIYLDINDLKKVINNARKNGVYQFDLTGGEPLLYSNLEELLEYLFKSGMIVRIFTNLTLFDDKILNLFLKYGVKDVVTSIDSAIAKDHDDFRGQDCSFKRTVDAINSLRNNSINVSVNSMIGEHNEKSISELVEFINKLNVNSVLDVIIPTGRAIDLGNDIKSSARIIRKIYDDYYNIVDFSAISVKCGIGDRFIYLKSDGNIYLCPSLIDDKYKLGYIKSYDTKKVWLKLTKKFGYLKCEKKCEICGKCNGGCRARALLLHDNLCDKDDVYCIVNGVEK